MLFLAETLQKVQTLDEACCLKDFRFFEPCFITFFEVPQLSHTIAYKPTWTRYYKPNQLRLGITNRLGLENLGSKEKSKKKYSPR